MNRQEIIEELKETLKVLENVNYMNYDTAIKNASQSKVHKAYNIIDKLKSVLEEEENNGEEL